MKKKVLWFNVFILLLIFINHFAEAQSLEERLQKFGAGFAKGYIQPFADAFGANLNSGIYHTADVSTGIDFYIGTKILVSIIPNSAKNFDANMSDLNSLRPSGTGQYPQSVRTATLFGDQGTRVISNGGIVGDTLQLPSGTDLSLFPLIVPQISIGNIFGIRAIIRYLPETKLEEYGKISFIGLGIQHDITQWLIGVPFDWSAHIMYQNLKVAPLMEGNAYSLGTEISKTFLFATLYGGLAYEYSDLSIKYDWQPPLQGVGVKKINFDLMGQNSYRATAGLSLRFLIIHVNAEYNLSYQPTAVIGVGIIL